MMIEVMCRIADGPLRPGELEIAQEAEPLVSWSVITRELSEERDWQGKDLAVELHFPDNTVWTGEAYPVTDIASDHQAPGQPVRLRGIGALSEDSIPVHSDAVAKRINAILASQESGLT
jgi:hypothetical protein